MNNSFKILTSTFIVAIGFLALLSNCSKDTNADSEEVTPSPRQLYEFSVPGAGFSVGCPTLVNDFIYIGTSVNLTYLSSVNNYFYKLDKTLHKIWEFPLSNKQLRGPASLDSYGNIYFVVDSGRTTLHGNAHNKIYSLDNSGKFRWSKVIGSLDQSPTVKNLAIASDNTIYALGDTLFAFDTNGNKKWTYFNNSFSAELMSAPIIDPNGNIYVITSGKIISLDKNGNQRWICDSGEHGGVSCPAFSKDNSNLIVAIYKTILSIQTLNGSINWKYAVDMNADFRSSPAVDDNNVIYIGSHGNGGEKDESALYAIKADGSGILWQFDLGSDIYSSPTLGNDRVIYIGSEGHGNTTDKHNRVHAIDMTNGNIKWSAQLSMDVLWGSPVLSNTGILYVSTMYIAGEEKSGIYGFKTDATGLLPNCGSPTYQLSNAHNGRR